MREPKNAINFSIVRGSSASTSTTTTATGKRDTQRTWEWLSMWVEILMKYEQRCCVAKFVNKKWIRLASEFDRRFYIMTFLHTHTHRESLHSFRLLMLSTISIHRRKSFFMSSTRTREFFHFFGKKCRKENVDWWRETPSLFEKFLHWMLLFSNQMLNL